MPRAPRDRSPNQRLREMIAACGMSYDAVARAVMRVAAENGEALSRRAGRPVTPAQMGYDHEPTARLLRARTGQARAGVGEVAVVRRVTRAFGAADEVLGGGHGLSAVAAYLADTATPLLSARFASEHSRREAFAAAAGLAWLPALCLQTACSRDLVSRLALAELTALPGG